MKWEVRGDESMRVNASPPARDWAGPCGRGRRAHADGTGGGRGGRAGRWGRGLTREDEAIREALEGGPSPHPWPNGMALG